MNATIRYQMQLQKRIEQLEAMLTALGVELPNIKGKNEGGDAATLEAENLVVARPVPEQWLTAKEVAKLIGRSHQWVKNKDSALPSSAKRLSNSGRRTRLYLWNDNTRHLFNIQL